MKVVVNFDGENGESCTMGDCGLKKYKNVEYKR